MRRRAAGLLALALACGGHAPPPRPRAGSLERVVRTPNHPPIVILERHGDPAAAMAYVVDTTASAAPGSTAIALAAIVRARLGSIARVSAQSDAIRVEALVDDVGRARTFADATRSALLAPVDDKGWEAARRALDAAPSRPDGAEALALSCLGAPARDGALTAESLETARARLVGWRAISVGLVAEASMPLTDALAGVGAWPEGVRAPARQPVQTAFVYDLYEVGAPRVSVQAWSAPDAAIARAMALRDEGSTLARKLRSSEPAGALSEVTAVAHPAGGCLNVRLEAASSDPTALARLAALTEDELANLPLTGATAADPRDEASTLAMAELAEATQAPSSTVTLALKAPDGVDASFSAQLELARRAWRAPALETRRLVEPGQGEALVLLASTCGTRSEDRSTEGATLALTTRLARQAAELYGVDAEPFVAWDGAGLLLRARARDGESRRAAGERLAAAAARTMLLDAPLAVRAGPHDSSPAGARGEPGAGLQLLAETLAPGHATWIEPRAAALAPPRTLEDARLGSLRRGPLRALVVANEDEAQADAMARVLDRALLRVDRACPADARVDAPRAGTYSVAAPGVSEAYLGLPLPAECGASGPWLAAALRSGLLARALVGVVRSSDARTLQAPSGPFLVVHLEAPGSALDAAVAQTRALLDRLRGGAMTAQDVAAAHEKLDGEARLEALDPRARAVRAWRGETAPATVPLDSVRACAKAALRDDALVIVAARSAVSP